MTKDELFNAFEQLFPNWAIYATSYRKIGSKALAITFNFHATSETDKEVSLVFLYNSLENWQFGTKLWRKRPERIAKKAQKEIESKA